MWRGGDGGVTGDTTGAAKQDIIISVSMTLCLWGYKHDTFEGTSGHLQLRQWQQNWVF